MQLATRAFTTSAGMAYPAGSFVVSMAQPKMGLIRYLLGRTFYPDNQWTRESRRDADPAVRHVDRHDVRVMGVRVEPLDDAAELGAVTLAKSEGEARAGGKSDAGPTATRSTGG